MEPLKRFEGGELLTNAYLLSTPDGGQLLIDAPGDTERWLAEIGVTPTALLLTHQHFDHVMAAAAIAKMGVPIYAWSDFDRSLMLEDLVRQWGMPFDVPEFTVDHRLDGLDELEIGGLKLELSHLPGHSPDSVIFHDPQRELLLAGDTLFMGSTGRADLPDGDEQLLYRGIREKIYTLPVETRVFPGHGPDTCVGVEKTTNPIVRE